MSNFLGTVQHAIEKGFKPLPYSKIETSTISRLYMQYRGIMIKQYVKLHATEHAIKNLETPPRVLHLATHGVYIGKDNLTESKPLVNSFLAFAGANLWHRTGQTSPTDNDGLLSALEVLGLNLDKTELVVLSACEAGQGYVDHTEGVYGLVRAFRIAGAHSVIMTIGLVSDKSSKDFMIQFYKNWLSMEPNKADPAAALRKTKLQYIKNKDPKRNNPRIWAPYVLIGGL